MAECISQVEFSFPHSKKITVTFDDTHISQDAGVLLLGKLDEQIGLTKHFSDKIPEWRDERLITHSLHDHVRARVFAIAQGYEDCNDLAQLRTEPLLLAACERGADGKPLPSQPSMSRLEHNALGKGPRDESPELERKLFASLRKTFVDNSIRRRKATGKPPKRIVLDLDSTDDPTHGQQHFSTFNGFYRHHCYQQLMILDERGDLLWLGLASGTENLREVGLKGLQEIHAALKAAFPHVQLLIRADNGFASPALYDWCEDNRVFYFINCGTGEYLQNLSAELVDWAEELFENQGRKELVKVFGDFQYQAKSWRTPRRIVAKAQRTLIGPDQRFLVTNSSLSATKAYEFYAKRGQMENWIKDLKLGMKAGRLSATSFRANSFRLLLFGLAYQLVHELREKAPPPLHKARLETIRLRLLKVAARVTLSTRRLWVRCSRYLHSQNAWLATAQALGI